MFTDLLTCCWNQSQVIVHSIGKHSSTSQQFAFPQIELFSFGRNLDISPRLSPPAARYLALPAASPSLFLLVGWRCCSKLLVYNPLLHASGTFSSLERKWYLCMNVSAFSIYNFFFRILQVLFVLQAVHWHVCLVGSVNNLYLPSTFYF